MVRHLAHLTSKSIGKKGYSPPIPIGRFIRWTGSLAILTVVGFVVRQNADHPSQLALLAAFAAFIALASVFVVLPNMLVHADDELGKADVLKLRNDVRLAGIQILGGAVVLGGLAFTYQTLKLNRQGQVTSRFTQATNQLGSEQLDVRLGGIFALQRIAHDSPDDAGPIMAILAAYLRHHAPSTGSNALSILARPTPAADVQAVATVLRHRAPNSDRLDLSSVDLGGVDLSGINLVGANLAGSNLAHAHLGRADLSKAILAGADLTSAHLANASLVKADLTNATLVRADLTKAKLWRARLTDGNLTAANLYSADLRFALLQHAVLSDATLAAINLLGADLSDANLSTSSGLSRDDLKFTKSNQQTRVPPGVRISSSK